MRFTLDYNFGEIKMTICVTKLNTGEELIGDFTENEDSTYSVRKPVVMEVIGVDKQGNLSVRMLPYMISDPEGMIHKLQTSGMMLLPQTVSQSIIQEYTRQTTGIELAH